MTVHRDLASLLAGPAERVAPRLLGMRLRTCSPEGETEVTLTEVEAYGGRGDPASHAHRGETARNRSMFGPPGTLYVYRSYGVHWCVNITTGLKGEGQAVLLRSGVPTEGRSLMIERRRRADHLADGPGKLAQALGITGEDDGTNVLGDSRVRLLPGTAPGRIVATPRVGISKATGRPWRFVEAEA